MPDFDYRGYQVSLRSYKVGERQWTLEAHVQKITGTGVQIAPFDITLGSKQVYDRNWLGNRTKTLLKALVVLGGDKVPTAQLADLLWPDSDADEGAHFEVEGTLELGDEGDPIDSAGKWPGRSRSRVTRGASLGPFVPDSMTTSGWMPSA